MEIKFGRLLLAMVGMYSSIAIAQNYPIKPVTVIVPFAAGGSSDVIARTVTQKLAQKWGQSFVIDYKPGANSSIGATATARSLPDGYTFMIGSVGTFAINQAVYKKLSYDPNKDLSYLSLAVRTPNVLVAAPNFPPNTVAELIAYSKSHPNTVSFATGGHGSSDHLSAVLFRQQTGITGIDVPFKGGAAAQNDIMASQVNVSFQNLGSVSTMIKSGKLKALAMTGDKRALQLPDVPTFSEVGVPGMVIYSWQAFAAPKGVPSQILDKLSTELRSAMSDGDVRTKLEGMGFEVIGSSPDDIVKFQREESIRWSNIVEKNKLAIDAP